jgi:hypothetical protein
MIACKIVPSMRGMNSTIPASVAVSHLPPAEAEAGLDLIAAGQELHRLVLLGLVIVLVHGH